ncbi:MAG: cell division protein FtsQ [Rhodobacterales bacterium]|nr:MAG: cell division protein FtsQ [Rhodobacterales bacterium]
MQQIKPRRHDPAPSRAAYKAQRLLLRPGFRRFVRFGLPVLALAVGGLIVLADQGRRDAISQQVAQFRRAIQERPEFMVKLMAIDGAGQELAAEIRQSLPIQFPITAFDLDLEAIRADIAKRDVVAHVLVQVRKGVLQIDVTERQPAMVWRGPEGLLLLDEGGHRVMPLAQRDQRPDLPLIAGAGANDHVSEARQILAAAGPLLDRVRGLERMGMRRWDLVLDRGQRILLPETDPVLALERVIALNTAQEMLARDLIRVDMRNANRPTIRIADSAVVALRKIRALQ